VFDILPTTYTYQSEKRYRHPISLWTGAPDAIKERENSHTVCDIKCPWSGEVFCDKIIALQSGLESYKEEFPEDYWQHISNAILLRENGFNITHFEAIIYCPYLEEIQIIKDMASNYDGDQTSLTSLFFAKDLPYILKDRKYKNLNMFEFEIPQTDIIALTARVFAASSLLK
jgi:hypothetical protein